MKEIFGYVQILICTFFSGERRRRRSLVHIFPANSGDVPFIEGKVYFGVQTPVSGRFAGVAGKF